MAFLFAIFASMIDRVKNIVFTILNKEKVGVVKPQQFIDSCIKNQNEIFSNYFDVETIRSKNREARGLANDSVKLYEQRIARFFSTSTLNSSIGVFALPSDCYFVDRRGISYLDSDGDVSDIDILKMPSFRRTSGSDTFPVGVFLDKTIKVDPITITDIDVDYYREPKLPNWTYTEVDGVAYFNGSSSQYVDLEIHPSEEPELIRMILSDFGIIKRETDLYQIINSLKKVDKDDESRIL